MVCEKCGGVMPGTFHEHEFERAEGRCVRVCKLCGYEGRSDHDYKRDKGADGRCIWRCTRCGAEMKADHEMQGRIRDGVCEEYCIYCGYTVKKHRWRRVIVPRVGWVNAGCTCELCGAVNPAGGYHEWESIGEGGFANIKVCKYCRTRDESEKITIEEAERSAREYEEAMERADSLHEMRAKGIKC